MIKKIKKILNRVLTKKIITYFFVGCFTTLLNIFLFKILINFNINYKAANVVTLAIVKITAYVCNKNIVFKSKCSSYTELLKEIFRFVFYRGLSALIDYFGLIAAVEWFGMDKIFAKIIITVVVVIINYITGSKVVFINKDE